MADEILYLSDMMLPSGEPREKLKRYLSASSETYGVSLLDETGESLFEWNQDEVFPAASSVKVHLATALLRKVQDGMLSLDQVHVLKDSDKVAGAGILKELQEGLKLSLLDLLKLAIVISDNTASNILIDYVGLDYIDNFLQANGYRATCLRRKFHIDPKAEPVNFISPREATDFLFKLWRCELISCQYRDLLIGIMLNQQYNEKLPLLLPRNIAFAHKTGDISTAANDMGIAFLLDESELRKMPPLREILNKNLQKLPIRSVYFVGVFAKNITRKRFMVDYRMGRIGRLLAEIAWHEREKRRVRT